MNLPPAVLALLSQLLAQEERALERFLAVLEEERRALLAGEAEAISAAVEEKNRIAETLQNCARQKLLLAAKSTGKTDEEAAHVLQEWMQEPSLAPVWERIRTLAERCQRANLENGTFIRERLALNQQALDVLLGAQERLTTYDALGTTRLRTATRRPLGSA